MIHNTTFNKFINSLLLCTLLWAANAQAEVKRVLVLNAYHEGYHWTDKIMSGIKSAFDSEKNVELFVNYMDTKRMSDEQHYQQLRDLYASKYRHLTFDVILSSDDHALDFLIKYRDELFPGVPVVFSGINNFLPNRLENVNGFTGIYEQYDVVGTLNLMLKLHPDTKQITVVSDDTLSGSVFTELVRQAEARANKALTYTYLVDEEPSLLAKRLQKISPDTIVLWAHYLRTSSGTSLSIQQSVKLVSESSPVPTYSIWDVVGQGVVGGKITSPFLQGKVSAEMAIDILGGKNVNEIPVSGSGLANVFDYQVLERFSIDSSQLPEDSIVRNKPFSFYDEYRALVWAGIAIVIIFFMFIITLLAVLNHRSKVEKMLRASEIRFRTLYNDAPVMMHSINDKAKIVNVNKQWLSTMGYQLDEVLGRKSTDFLTEQSRKLAEETVLPQFFETGSCEDIPYQLVTKNKKIIDVRLSAASYFDPSTNAFTSLAVLIDETSKLLAESQARRAQKMDALGKLTGGIAHDYNNMLGVILGYVDLLKILLKDQPKGLKYADHIQRAGLRGAKLTQKLLGFSRKTSTKSEVININTPLLNAQHMIEKLLTARIQLKFELADKVSNVEVDESDLEDAIINLSINAMHAMENNGELHFKTQDVLIDADHSSSLKLPPGSYVALSVSDNGIGMDEETKEKVFEPFFTTKGQEGTGLGLTQVYGFVKRSGGIIDIQSSPNNGTTVTMYFPRHLESDIDSTVDTPKGAIYQSNYSNETILVVDDEPALLELTQEILERQKYKVFTANNGQEALNVLEKEPIALMLSDVIMPEMDGYQLAAIAKEKYPNLKIQLASGYTGEKDQVITVGGLNDELLTKPYDAETLLRTIEEQLKGN